MGTPKGCPFLFWALIIMFLDRFIVVFDQALRTVFVPAISSRHMPGDPVLSEVLSAEEKRRITCLMRVNHSGEICAQALYQGQAITARNPEVQQALLAASKEEVDHLAWCETRLQELGGRKSFLNPVWYGASFAVGAFSGLLGDRWNLGFLMETERQVEGHLQSHLDRLPIGDLRTRAIVEQMKLDEASHAQTAYGHGAVELPRAVKLAMRLTSNVMTRVAHWV